MKIRQYARLKITEREEISRYLTLGYNESRIAKCLKRSRSTIFREIKRSNMTVQNYRAITADKHAKNLARLRRKKPKLVTNNRLRGYVLTHLHQRWSPEQIEKSLFKAYPRDMSMRVSSETIYTYLYTRPRGELKKRISKFLRQRHLNRRSRKGRRPTNPIQDYVSIDLRPPEVNARKAPGHWESDLIMGARNESAIGTLVERMTRFILLVKLESKDAISVCEAFSRKMNRLPKEFKKTMTHDQGQEMRTHSIITQKTKIRVYLAHPHSPWERGTNENTNMLIRDFYPKGTDFSKISARQLKRTQDLLNGRPRKILNWNSPIEVFNTMLR